MFVSTAALSAGLDTTYFVPVAGRLQGVTFYRTSLLIGGPSQGTSDVRLVMHYRSRTDGTLQTTAEASLGKLPGMGSFGVDDVVEKLEELGAIRMAVIGVLRYRSSMDGTMQTTQEVTLGSVAPRQGFTIDDVVQQIESAAALRAVDVNAPIIGMLELTLPRGQDYVIVSRCYTATADGGSYASSLPVEGLGESLLRVGFSSRDLAGSTAGARTDLAVINLSNQAGDVSVTLIDGESGNTLTSWSLSSRVGHLLAPGELAQFNDLFSDPAVPSSVKRLSIVLRGVLSGYLSTIDSGTGDGNIYALSHIPYF